MKGSAGVVLALCGTAMAEPSLYEGHHMVMVTASTPEQVAALDGLGVNLACREGLGVQLMIVGPEHLAALDALNLPMVTVSENAQAVIDEQRAEIIRAHDDRDAAFFTTYRRTDEISDFVDDLVAMAPGVATRFNVGTSIQNRQIFGVKITGPGGGSKPKVVINSCQHAREWISPMAVCWAAEQLALGYGVDSEITNLLNAVEVHIIPVVNPDGYEFTYDLDRYWRKNRRLNGGGAIGVDLNRNWAYQFGGADSSGSPGSELYRGASAFSEPETAALSAYITSIAGSTSCIGDCSVGNRCSSVRGHLDVHTAGALVLGAWSYSTTAIPPREDLLRVVTTEMTDAIAAEESYPYLGGLGTDALLTAASGVAQDWSFANYGALAWTYELRPNTGGLAAFSPPASEIVPAGSETFAGILALLHRVATPMVDPTWSNLPAVIEQFSSVEVRVSTIFDECAGVPNATLFWRTAGGGAFSSTSMGQDGTSFVSGLSAGACGSVKEYYIQLQQPGSALITRIPETPGTYLTATTYAATPVFADNFQTNLGWTVTNDGSLTDGQWTRGVPVTPASPGAPSTDADFSGQCYLTDNAAGNSDVDGGATTLTSPTMNASNPNSYIEYSRWYDNTMGAFPGTDSFVIQVSDNNGATWKALETVGPGGGGGAENNGGWINKSFKVNTIPAMTNTTQFKIRFIAQDPNPASTVEAGVDAVRLVKYTCGAPGCPGDVNHDGFTNSADFNILAGHFGQSVPANTNGDLDGNGVVNSADFNILAGAFGCAP